jgi:hypothetical protein
MGIEFIRAKGGKPYVKRWAKGHERATTPGLFDVQFNVEARVATATLSVGVAPQAGAAVILQRSGPDLMVFDGLKPVGKILNPPPSMTTVLDACHGLARGVVDRVGGLGQTAEIRF